jgi:hypothetical protein
MRLRSLGLIALALLGGCSDWKKPGGAAEGYKRNTAQTELHVPKSAPLLFQAKVEGVGVYSCEGVDPNAWTYRITEATLFDEQSRQIGVQAIRFPSKGTWTMHDGSIVSGETIQTVPAVKALPWLLVAVRDHRGAGTLANVESIRQIATKGGVPPVALCTETGSELRVPFSAVQQFYGAGEPE